MIARLRQLDMRVCLFTPASAVLSAGIDRIARSVTLSLGFVHRAQSAADVVAHTSQYENVLGTRWRSSSRKLQGAADNC